VEGITEFKVNVDASRGEDIGEENSWLYLGLGKGLGTARVAGP